jgi:hypothetical protein
VTLSTEYSVASLIERGRNFIITRRRKRQRTLSRTIWDVHACNRRPDDWRAIRWWPDPNRAKVRRRCHGGARHMHPIRMQSLRMIHECLAKTGIASISLFIYLRLWVVALILERHISPHGWHGTKAYALNGRR